MATDLDYSELERLAYISGQLELARLYDMAAVYARIDIDTLAEVADRGLDDIKQDEYARGFEDGKQAASDAELLQKIKALEAQVKTLEDTHIAIYNSYAYFLNWLNGSEAKLAANRKQAIRNQEINLLRWRRP